MAAWKIFSIGKANQRIEELEAENANLKAQIKAQEDSVPEAVSGLKAELDKSHTELSAAKADAEKANAKAKELQSSLAAKDGEIAALKTQLEAKGKEVEQKAAVKAAEIAAQTGAPAAPVIPAAAKEAQAPKGATGMSRILTAAKADLQAAGYTPKAS